MDLRALSTPDFPYAVSLLAASESDDADRSADKKAERVA
jgi:hypothetical protein